MKSLVLVVVLSEIAFQVLGGPADTSACDYRYFQHYLAKDCTPVFEASDSKCPVRFRCPIAAPDDASGCRFQGDVIPVGNAIPTGNPCQLCSCHKGWSKNPRIVCVGVECPSAFGPPLEESCYEVFKPDSCCSTEKKCGPNSEILSASRSTCEHRGKSYQLGQQIHSVEDPCLVCTCTEEWTGIPETDPGCRRMSCVLEKDLDTMRSGCTPIYHEATCCPIEYECGENVKNTTVPLATSEEFESGSTCVFKGSHYQVGQSLDVKHPTNCVTCDCVTPPEFTCVHKSCVWPEGEDQCTPVIEPGECCPSFDCPSSSK